EGARARHRRRDRGLAGVGDRGDRAARGIGDLELDAVLAIGLHAELVEDDGQVVGLEPEPHVLVRRPEQDPVTLDAAAFDRPQPHLEVLGMDLAGQSVQRAVPDRSHGSVALPKPRSPTRGPALTTPAQYNTQAYPQL